MLQEQKLFSFKHMSRVVCSPGKFKATFSLLSCMCLYLSAGLLSQRLPHGSHVRGCVSPFLSTHRRNNSTTPKIKVDFDQTAGATIQCNLMCSPFDLNCEVWEHCGQLFDLLSYFNLSGSDSFIQQTCYIISSQWGGGMLFSNRAFSFGQHFLL